MEKKPFNGTIVKPYADIPARTFDLVPHFVNHYGYKDDMVACKQNGQWVKYSGTQFEQMTDAISIGLMHLGVGKGDRVAVISNNCPLWNMVDFAVQQIGAILVPIYPTVRHSDYEHIINHAEPKVIFVEGKVIFGKVRDILETKAERPKVFSFNQLDGVDKMDDFLKTVTVDEAAQSALKAREDAVETDDVATIIYTSGTLGMPKGVMLTHRNLMSDVAYYGPHFPVPPSHKIVSFLPLSHILERSVFYTHVFLGNSTYYVENFGTIMRDIGEVGPNHFLTVPRVIEKVYNGIMRKGEKLKGLKKHIFNWAFDLADRYDESGRTNGRTYLWKLGLADCLVFKEIKKSFGGNLEFIISGGAALHPRLVKLFAAMGIPIIEGYGLTETSPVISVNSITQNVVKAGTVGLTCQNLDVRIVPETGEIIVKGSSVMKGYYKDEEQTRAAIDDAGYFHTGDIGEFDEDGLLKITGRLKEIFKDSMGKYISPVLIENRFVESPFFSNMMVVGENQKFAAALIVPNFEYLRNWSEENNITYTSDAEMIQHRLVVERFRQEVDHYNKFFGDFEKVKRFELIDREWTIEEGEITPSLKIRRKVIAEHYKELIDSMFEE